jgi:hypothetical protein
VGSTWSVGAPSLIRRKSSPARWTGLDHRMATLRTIREKDLLGMRRGWRPPAKRAGVAGRAVPDGRRGARPRAVPGSGTGPGLGVTNIDDRGDRRTVRTTVEAERGSWPPPATTVNVLKIKPRRASTRPASTSSWRRWRWRSRRAGERIRPGGCGATLSAAVAAPRSALASLRPGPGWMGQMGVRTRALTLRPRGASSPPTLRVRQPALSPLPGRRAAGHRPIGSATGCAIWS